MLGLIRVLILIWSVSLVRAADKCCQGNVCFNDDSPFNDFPLPRCIEDIQPVIHLFTRSNPTKALNITHNHIPYTTGSLTRRGFRKRGVCRGPRQVYSSYPHAFDGGKLTIFFVPGATEEKDPAWIYDLKNAALTRGDYNIIVVDWEEIPKNLPNEQIAADARALGKEIALVAANLLTEAKVNRSTLYCVGHSVGTNVCGYAGMMTKFGRMTGLDPPGGVFDDRDWTIGLNPTCADLVEVIHTNGYSPYAYAGTMRRLGHVDFYPNGGKVQPGCPASDPHCNHMRAVDLYLESILTPCFLSRYECLEHFNLPSSCEEHSEPIQNMGFSSNEYSAHGIFYLTTGSSEPFCNG